MIYCYYSRFMLYINSVKIPTDDRFFKKDYCDLYNLYRLTIKTKPKVSLEVGSGYSTLIFCEALKRISEREKEEVGRIHYCLEQDEKFLKIIKDYLYSDYSKYIRFIKTDLIVKEIANQKVSICRNFPDVSINLFYEDRTDHKKFPIAGDAISIEDKMPSNFTICIDGMRRTVDFYKRNLQRDYIISGRGFHGTNFVPVKKGL